VKCADCDGEIVGEPWELEDGRTVCGGCCARDLRQLVAETVALRGSLRQENASLRERLKAAKGEG
jgi:hypothetical protein